MRTLRFAKIAAEAERLRLTHLVRRYATRAACALAAVVFLLSMMATAHVAAWLALVQMVVPVYAALILVGADLLLATVFLLLAARGAPGEAEREAKALRDVAVAQIARPGLLSGPVYSLVVDRVLRLLGQRIFAGRRR